MLICRYCKTQRNVRVSRAHYRKGFCSVKCQKKMPLISFYDSKEWRSLRYQVLKEQGRICALCKSRDGRMHVDHIKPRSLYPELALVFENLQVLCEACNLGKSNRDETDWRRSG